jgi:hypothetical protein
MLQVWEQQCLVSAVQSHLWTARKQLTVLVGALKSPEPALSISPFALRANDITEDEEDEADRDNGPGNGYTSPLIMQFFQACHTIVHLLHDWHVYEHLW